MNDLFKASLSISDGLAFDDKRYKKETKNHNNDSFFVTIRSFKFFRSTFQHYTLCFIDLMNLNSI